jgi:plasmid stability protein
LQEREKDQQMTNRRGVFIGAYVPNELKESLRRRAAADHRTLSQEITRILTEAVHGQGLPAGSVDRRQVDSTTPRRRSTDPMPRRRSEDLPYVAAGADGSTSR